MTALRNVFLLLLLANLGALAVFNWVIERPEPSPEYDGPGLTLLRELDPNTPIARPNTGQLELESAAPVEGDLEQDSFSAEDSASPDVATDEDLEAAEEIESAPAPAPAEEVADTDELPQAAVEFSRCISIGPFADEADSAQANNTLIEAGFEPSSTIRENEVWDGYWVYIGQIEDLASARAIQAELAQRGLEDTQVISSAESGNLLSLGVFSEITRAGSQSERATELGYEATIADNMTTRETYWLDIELTSEQSVALEMLQAPGQISRLETLDCASE